VDDTSAAVRQAGEAALGLYSAEGRDQVSAAVLAVYGARLLQGGVEAGGQVIYELVAAHALALVRLAELRGVPLGVAAAELVSLVSKGTN
jgi:hypothetical protein